MLVSTNIKISKKLIQLLSLQELEIGKISLNEPTGDFFYDQWRIKPEYKETVWNKVLKTLPKDIGEARIIVLASGTNYFKHADIDDRYHLNLFGQDSYLVDLDNKQLHELKQDGVWYLMDAGRIHSAVNFGEQKRIQLVVRKLLTRAVLKKPCTIKIIGTEVNARFVFDNTISGWLNTANKKGIMTDFKIIDNGVEFNLEFSEYKNLKKIVPAIFQLKLI
jgi:hypothetical protein